MNIYRDIFETLTNMKKILNRSFNTPASKVRGSPITGTQANNKDQRPYFWKYFWLLFNCSGDTGNHFRSWNIIIFFPKYQLNTDPKIFPELATIKSIFLSNKFVNSIVVKTISEDKGNIVAAKKLIIKSFK